MLKYSFIFLLFTQSLLAHSQVFSNRANLKKDTSKASYPYILPILGKKTAAAGFDLPYSAGIGINYLWQQSDIVVNNLNVGFNNGPQHNLDNIVQFNNATATSNGFNIRPDIWVLPFLNVYGIFARSQSSTAIDIDLRVPTDPSVAGSDWKSIANFQTKANFTGTTTGFGLTPTIGVRGCWMAFDMNFSWTDIQELDKPAFIYVFGPRVGKAFKLKKPEQSISFWTGGFRVHMNSGTSGSLPIGDFIETDGIHEKIDNGYTQINAANQNVDAWWSGLTPTEQQRPGNIAKKNAADEALGKAQNVLDDLSGAVNTADNSTVQYSLDKKQKQIWNLLVGAQFQYNKHWMIRGEAGILGSRSQVIVGLQYRFGL